MRGENKLAASLEEIKDTRLFFRDQEIDNILYSMVSGVCTYVYGSVGTGKTTAVKKAIQEFNESRYKAVYIDCSTRKTEHAVLKGLIDQINDAFNSRIFIELRSNADIVRKLEAELRKIPDLKVVVLDHMEALEEGAIVDDLLEMKLAVILVSDDTKAIHKISAMSQPHFGNVIHFTDYAKEQVREILHSKAERIFSVFSSNRITHDESLIARIADLCNGNIGYAESMLVASLLKAAAAKKKTVDETDIPIIEENKEPAYDEKLILDVLKEQGSLPSGQLYRKYCERTKFPKAERTFRNLMRNLCEKNLARAIGTNKGRVYEIVTR